jgi:hypothetical protein
MIHGLRSHRAALLAGGALLLLSACPGDDAPVQTTASEGPDPSTGASTVEPPPVTTAEGSSSGVDPDATAGTVTADSSGTTVDPTTGDVTTGDVTVTTGSGSSSSDSGGETGTGEQGYGDCFNNPAMDVCLAGETCIDDAGTPPGVGVCALQECGGAGECPSPPPGGDASPACMDVTGDMVDECVLQCTGGANCPTGMSCFADFVCVWAPGLGPGDFSCADENLGSALGSPVITGSTGGQGNDFDAGCIGQDAADVAYVWTALVGGTYTFDTLGSSYDTVLSLREDCVGPELECNDDTVMLTSQVTLDMVAGQSVLIVVDGYGNSTGSFDLNIQ